MNIDTFVNLHNDDIAAFQKDIFSESVCKLKFLLRDGRLELAITIG